MSYQVDFPRALESLGLRTRRVTRSGFTAVILALLLLAQFTHLSSHLIAANSHPTSVGVAFDEAGSSPDNCLLCLMLQSFDLASPTALAALSAPPGERMQAQTSSTVAPVSVAIRLVRGPPTAA